MDPEKKSLNSIFPTKYVIPKSLKFSHWPSKMDLEKITVTSPSIQKTLVEPRSHFRKEIRGVILVSCGAINEFLRGLSPGGRGKWGTLRIPREDWGIV